MSRLQRTHSCDSRVRDRENTRVEACTDAAAEFAAILTGPMAAA